MTENIFENDVKKCVSIIKEHGVILYPTDTIWGLGCDIKNEKAIEKIFKIKKRDKQKSFVILMTDVQQLSKYIANPPLEIDTILEQYTEPTTIIYPDAINLPNALIASDGSIAVRITKDTFCRSLIKRLRSPIVSTSANMSGDESPTFFKKIKKEIIQSADYVVKYKQDDETISFASSILKYEKDGSFKKLR